MTGLRGACAAALCAVLTACATPTERFEDRAAALGFSQVDLRGESFRHRAYAAGLGERGDTLHVYVEHDGTPWLAERYVSDDPTPRTPLALELMARDKGPRLLLGRPCYFEYRNDPGCSPLLWTHRRYSSEVVTSMVAALRAFLDTHPYRSVLLVGYSGGGTLAWLMARHVPETVGVVTVAANLDVDGWASLHGFTPLAGSLNPALLPPLSPAVAQVNFVGGRDRNVPPGVVASFSRRHPESKVVVVDEFDHQCCWTGRWPELLAGRTSH
jgi:hypothetical protein